MDGQREMIARPDEAFDTNAAAARAPRQADGPAAVQPVPLEEIGNQCKSILVRATNAARARKLLPEAIALAERYPDLLEPQLTRAQVRELTRVTTGMLEEWQHLYMRFPACDAALRLLLRWMHRLRRTEGALALIEDHFHGQPTDFADRLTLAELYIEIRDYERSDRAFRDLIEEFPNRPTARVRHAKRLIARGLIVEAHRTLLPVADTLSGEAAGLFERVDQALTALLESVPLEEIETGNFGSIALREAIGEFEDRVPREAAEGRLGRVVLVTGTLGAGGSERQMTRLAAHLERARLEGARIDGVAIDGPVEVAVKSLYSKEGDDFFLPVLKRAGVATRQMQDMDPVALPDVEIANPRLKAICQLLPLNAAFGVGRLVPYLRRQATDCVFIWQDGAVLVAALAALIAGVPRIVINLRGLPPNIRTNLLTPEYQDMYAALAKVPGVRFVSNSRAAAAAYCDWIGIGLERFDIVPNGVPAQSVDVSAAEGRIWHAFSERTSDATETIGGVFRFDHNKRPLLWIAFAHEYLKRRPKARFVLVGSGNMMPAVRKTIARLGIADRVLVAGRSQHVGFWLAKFDALYLLSRYEGLPNVLIEAQTAGVPVVSTPAGGACEAFVHGVTGFALSCAESPDVEEFCVAITRIVDDSSGSMIMRQSAREWASDQFSVERMVRQTIQVLSGRKPGAPSRPELESFASM